MKLAVIEIGSNSIRTSIYRSSKKNRFKTLDRWREPVRLGKSIAQSRLLTNEQIEETIDVLKKFQRRIQRFDVDRVSLIATAAVRLAKNQSQLIFAVLKETGLQLEVIDEKEEAYYDYVAVRNTMRIKDSLIVDVGGGSSEISLAKKGRLKQGLSIPIGAISISDVYLTSDPIKESELKRAREAINEHLESLQWINTPATFVGLGGTMRALASILNREGKKKKTLHNSVISCKQMDALFDRLLHATNEERSQIKELSDGRFEVILGGMLILTEIIKKTPSKEIRFSNFGVREGYVFNYFYKVNKMREAN
ncbi:Ppx/GppA family phosphatase [Companilactobacillus mishanensis]|uniref:Ppx/GppA family phosphatase n=1 Tax=Companilactobacillus mishanensis TaxID=2486008 RepID=A0A5P0ZH79_9LACO|nr:Ppx/GppA family phosphatase [Companilactobacillus mishanensis]MQS44983.1 Ppx/GppA family phosphatase [Companilactobacillus mishanensis]MQS52338.1 Ppx/GppA family phosphatase [Companilactobacillus mishanensis]